MTLFNNKILYVLVEKRFNTLRRITTKTSRSTQSRRYVRDTFRAWINQAAQVSAIFKFKFNDMIIRKDGRPMFKPLLLLVNSLGFHLRKSMVRIIYVFIRDIVKLKNAQGFKGLTLYLKNSHLYLMQSVAGYFPDNSGLKPRVGRAGDGIPCIIPLVHRNRIRSGDVRILRLWLSLLSLYRVFQYPGNFKLETIYEDSPFTALSPREQEGIIGLLTSDSFMKKFYSYFGIRWHYISRGKLGFDNLMFDSVEPFIISKSAPHAKGGPISTSPDVLIRQAVSIVKTGLFEHFEKMLRGLPKSSGMLVYMLRLSALWHPGITTTSPKTDKLLPSAGKDLFWGVIEGSNDPSVSLHQAYPTGRLGTKIEAAGKVRVFAMVDAWTQWLLKPIHDYIFTVLRKVSMDGTFDQLAPLKELDKISYQRYFSFDLSAATDRLPVALQSRILFPLLGRGKSESWRSLLTDRLYFLDIKTSRGLENHWFKYRAGQPMGALSSWAMLALTHHYIIQYCWWSLGNRHLFKDYAVLGDDVVICSGKVANRYLSIMRLLGVDINLSKSIASGHAYEFAKRFIYKKSDVSPLAFKELGALGENLTSIGNFLSRWKLSDKLALIIGGAGFRMLGSFRDKNILRLGPKFRAIMLYISRNRMTPFAWFSMYSYNRMWELSPELYRTSEKFRNITWKSGNSRNPWIVESVGFHVLIDIVNLYLRIMKKEIDRKAGMIGRVLKKLESESKSDESLRLSHDLIMPSALHWDDKLSEIWKFSSNISKVTIDRYSFNWIVTVLREDLDKVNSCPDFSELLSRKDVKEDANKKTFCQEVAIWMTISSKISQLNLKKIPMDMSSDPMPDMHPSLLEKRDGIISLILKEIFGSLKTMFLNIFLGYNEVPEKTDAIMSSQSKLKDQVIPGENVTLSDRDLNRLEKMFKTTSEADVIVTHKEFYSTTSSEENRDRIIKYSPSLYPLVLYDPNPTYYDRLVSRPVIKRNFKPFLDWLWKYLLWCYLFGVTFLLLISSVPQYIPYTENYWPTPDDVNHRPYFYNLDTELVEDSGYGWWWILLLLFGCGLLIYLFSTFSRDISGSSDLPSITPEEIINDLTRIEQLGLTSSQELVLKDLVSCKLVEDSILRDRLINLTGSLSDSLKICEERLASADVPSSSYDLTIQYAEKITETGVLSNSINLLKIQIRQIKESLEATTHLLTRANARINELESLQNQPSIVSIADSFVQTSFEQGQFATDRRLYDLANEIVLNRPVYTFNNRIGYGHTLDSQMFVNFTEWNEFMAKISQLALYLS